MNRLHYAPEKPRTICAECEYGQSYLKWKEKGKSHIPEEVAWCEAPEARESLGWSVVTGIEKCNFLLCVSINKGGNCSYFKLIEDPPLAKFMTIDLPPSSTKAITGEGPEEKLVKRPWEEEEEEKGKAK